MNREMLRSITEDELQTFRRDGVVHLRKIIDLEWIQQLNQAIDELIVRTEKPADQVLDFTGLALASDSASSQTSSATGMGLSSSARRAGFARYAREAEIHSGALRFGNQRLAAPFHASRIGDRLAATQDSSAANRLFQTLSLRRSVIGEASWDNGAYRVASGSRL